MLTQKKAIYCTVVRSAKVLCKRERELEGFSTELARKIYKEGISHNKKAKPRNHKACNTT